jgi:hypothetical protein
MTTNTHYECPDAVWAHTRQLHAPPPSSAGSCAAAPPPSVQASALPGHSPCLRCCGRAAAPSPCCCCRPPASDARAPRRNTRDAAPAVDGLQVARVPPGPHRVVRAERAFDVGLRGCYGVQRILLFSAQTEARWLQAQLRERRRVREALQHAVHEARVAEVDEPRALLVLVLMLLRRAHNALRGCHSSCHQQVARRSSGTTAAAPRIAVQDDGHNNDALLCGARVHTPPSRCCRCRPPVRLTALRGLLHRSWMSSSLQKPPAAPPGAFMPAPSRSADAAAACCAAAAGVARGMDGACSRAVQWRVVNTVARSCAGPGHSQCRPSPPPAMSRPRSPHLWASPQCAHCSRRPRS